MYQGLKKFITSHEEIYLAARLAKGVFRDGYTETKERYKVFRYEQMIARDGEGKPFLLYSEREKLIREAPSNVRLCIIAFFENTPEDRITPFIHSILVQSYVNWTMVLVDRNRRENKQASKLLRKSAGRSRKIKYQKISPAMNNAELFRRFFRKNKADYYVYLTQECLLYPTALTEIVTRILEKGLDFVYTDEAAISQIPADAHHPFYKPEYSPDTLRSCNYVGSAFTFKRALTDGAEFSLNPVGKEPTYDLILHLTEQTDRIGHISKILCYQYNNGENACGHLSEERKASEEEALAITEHLRRKKLKGKVQGGSIPSTFRIVYEISGSPLISIIIPNKDHVADLRVCIQSIAEKSTWTNWEIIIVENNSSLPETEEYYEEIKRDERIRIVKWREVFNYSRVCNYGVSFAKGDFILLLNNDTEVISPDWMEQMVMFAQRADVGAVGAKLYYKNDTVQHAGVIIDPIWTSFHYFRNLDRTDSGYAFRLKIVQNLSACTGACLLVKKKNWEEIGGLDENFAISYNDIDFCMRLRERGYLIVWTPFAELYHHELKSRGDNDTPEKVALARREGEMFRKRWEKVVAEGDPYYNMNLKGQMLGK